MMSDMTVERASITARDLSRRAGSVLDRVEHGERLVVTRDGEQIAEIIPIDRARRMLARWIQDALITPPPEQVYAKAAEVSDAARRSLAASPSSSQAASEALRSMR